MQIEQTATTDLIPYVSNSRTHSEGQVAQIAASIKEFGFNNPVLVDKEKGIIAGHGRVLAARKLGMDKVPTVELSHLTETQRKAYIIADNKLALNADWDIYLLGGEIADLDQEGFDLDLLGFTEQEVENLFDPLGDDFDRQDAWGGMPEYISKDETAYRTLIVHFEDQAALDAFLEINGKSITEKTKTLWFPEQVNKNLGKQYES